MRTPEEPSGLRQGPLSLPSGGGSIRGMGQTLSAIGPDGMAEMSLPLPMSAGRGYAPALGLTYSSGAGNGPFGIGWQMGTMSIRRRTSHGTPRYDSTDSFLGRMARCCWWQATQKGSRMSAPPTRCRV